MPRPHDPCQLNMWDTPPAREGLPKPLDLPGATVWFLPAFLAPQEAAEAFGWLRALSPWKASRRQMYEREVAVPRLTAWYGTQEAWPEALVALRERVASATGFGYDGVLCNLYRDGQDSVAWHADDVEGYGHEEVIASLSLGATRRFLLRPKPGHPGEALSLYLPPGSLLLMGPGTQAHWEHCVPKTRRPVGERINLTFRKRLAKAAPSAPPQALRGLPQAESTTAHQAGQGLPHAESSTAHQAGQGLPQALGEPSLALQA